MLEQIISFLAKYNPGENDKANLVRIKSIVELLIDECEFNEETAKQKSIR